MTLCKDKKEAQTNESLFSPHVKDTPDNLFFFTPDNLAKAQEIITHYPKGREASAVLALLDMAQRQIGGWLTSEALAYIAAFLKMPLISLYEIVRFYTLFTLKPCGQYVIQVCTTVPCWLKGADETCQVFQKDLGIFRGETTQDGMFTLKEVECLGACINAPVVHVNDKEYHNVTPERVPDLLMRLQQSQKE